MDEAPVVSFRYAAEGGSFLEAARRVEARATTLGGVLVAFSGGAFAFSFAHAEIARALELIGELDETDDLSGTVWAVGIAEGELELLADDGAHGELACGPGLVTAEILSRAAGPGEILCTEAIASLASRAFVVSGERVAREGQNVVCGVRIAPIGSESNARALDARVLAGDVDKARELFAALMPDEPSTARELRPDTQVSTGASTTHAARRSGAYAEATKGSVDDALERWANGLCSASEGSRFTERMRVLSRLRSADLGDALRVLRRARADLEPKDHAQRCQASLAIAVVLSVAGRPQEALLEGMDALARARHAEDQRGASACLAFLARLFRSVGRDGVMAANA